ncbi:MAG: VWA domain-containing protein [Alphaproteobacteria bacterium]|nr:VWA domain-containing protein [Alphaproteobacteria bacterium]
MSDFHFIRPAFLYAFLIFLFIPFFFKKKIAQKNLWSKVCDENLLMAQTIKKMSKGNKRGITLLIITWSLAIIALAGPTNKKLPMPTFNRGIDIVYVLDVSILSKAADLKPNRLTRATFKITDISNQLKGTQLGLILYDDIPFTAMPLTPDTSMIKSILPSISSGIMGENIPQLSKALKAAHSLLKNAKSKNGHIILLTGYADSEAILTAKEIANDNYKISAIGIGTKEKTPIIKTNGQFLTNSSGKAILGTLTSNELKQITNIGNGTYSQISLDDSDISKIINQIKLDNSSNSQSLNNDIKADVWQDFGIYFCLALIPFAILLFRKGWLFIIVLSLSPSISNATPFINSDYENAKKIIDGKTDVDPNVFDDLNWKGIANYKNKNYDKAIKFFSLNRDIESKYNIATSLAKASKLQEALKLYNEILKENPNHADSIYNKKIIEDLLKQQQNQQQNNTDKNQSKDNQNNKSNQNNSDSSQNNDQQNNQSNDTQEQSSQNQSSSKDQNAKEDNSEINKNQNSTKEKSNEEKTSNNKYNIKEDDKQTGKEQDIPVSASGDEEQKEKKAEQEQWLKLIKDDPSGLLRARIRRHRQIQDNIR